MRVLLLWRSLLLRVLFVVDDAVVCVVDVVGVVSVCCDFDGDGVGVVVVAHVVVFGCCLLS